MTPPENEIAEAAKPQVSADQVALRQPPAAASAPIEHAGIAAAEEAAMWSTKRIYDLDRLVYGDNKSAVRGEIQTSGRRKETT